MECGTSWDCEDTNLPGPCPDCDSNEHTIERCEDCPLRQLDEQRLHSDAGKLLDRVLDLEFSIEHFKLGWDDVTAEEAKALQILLEERAKHKHEEQDRDAMERQMKASLKR